MYIDELPDSLLMEVLLRSQSLSCLKNLKNVSKKFANFVTNHETFLETFWKQKLKNIYKTSSSLFRSLAIEWPPIRMIIPIINDIRVKQVKSCFVCLSIGSASASWYPTTTRLKQYEIETEKEASEFEALWNSFKSAVNDGMLYNDMIAIRYYLPMHHDPRFHIEVLIQMMSDGCIYRDVFDEHMGFWDRHRIMSNSSRELVIDDIRPVNWTANGRLSSVYTEEVIAQYDRAFAILLNLANHLKKFRDDLLLLT